MLESERSLGSCGDLFSAGDMIMFDKAVHVRPQGVVFGSVHYFSHGPFIILFVELNLPSLQFRADVVAPDGTFKELIWNVGEKPEVVKV